MALIYHLAPAARWTNWLPGADYLPAEYAADGFVHCTAGDELMVQVANRFYRGVLGDFVLLVIDADRLSAELRWEEPPEGGQLFPHIYGAIDAGAIVEVRAVRRAEDGTFLGW